MPTGATHFRNRKSARAACQCTALIAVIAAVNASVIARSDSTRRARTIITDGSVRLGRFITVTVTGSVRVKITVKMLTVKI